MTRLASLVLVSAVFAACSDDGATTGTKGNAEVFVVAEESISGGIEAGTGDENIQDGWTVSYSKFLISIGNFRARGGDISVSDPSVYVLDLKNAPSSGYVIASFKDINAIRYDKVGSDMPVAPANAKVLAPTTEADKKLLVDGGFSLYIEGTLSKADGKSCTPGKPTECTPAPGGVIKFKWGFAMGTSFDDCASAQGDTGFAVPSGGTEAVKPTIHGDHWFFSDLTQGAEVTKRYAQFIADADLDRNGETTIDELKMVKAADAFPADKYKLSGGIDGPIATAWDYVRSQARTIHDFQGDGECPTRAVLK